jgi:sterol desaturase/sphingolipid hydroxylase (fatty acid hydroxylase superfamily)
VSAEPGYEYKSRQVPEMSGRYLRVGQGRISGYVSAFLGVMAFLTVLCFKYPAYLTTEELRHVYDPDQVRLVLRVGICVSLGFGLVTFAIDRRKRMGAVGILFTLAALALGGWNVHGAPVTAEHEVTVGLDWLLLDFLLSVVVFTFIEKVIPKYEDQAILRPEWRTDLVYFGMNHLAIGVLLLVGNSFAPMMFGWATNARLQAFMTSLPVAVQFVILVFAADFVQYWIHRAYHEIPWMWKFHAVHHSSENMDWLAGSRTHFVETLVDRSLIMVPLYLLGPDKAALDAYVIFAALIAVLIHANVGIPFGPIKYLLTTPQYHHWHHSSDKPAIDTNYAAHVPLWDKLFGTYHMPHPHWPAEYGTTKRLPRTLVAQFIYPFRRTDSVVESR